MKDLTYNEKIAVLKILSDIVNADNVVCEKEIGYLNEVARSFDLIDNYKKEVDSLETPQALSIIRELPMDVKEKIIKLMGKMIVIDEDINYNEVKFYNTVCETCKIENGFNIEDYPDCTLSGPFVNPEDL